MNQFQLLSKLCFIIAMIAIMVISIHLLILQRRDTKRRNMVNCPPDVNVKCDMPEVSQDMLDKRNRQHRIALANIVRKERERLESYNYHRLQCERKQLDRDLSSPCGLEGKRQQVAVSEILDELLLIAKVKQDKYEDECKDRIRIGKLRYQCMLLQRNG